MPPPIAVEERGTVVARVGDFPITGEAVVAIAKKQHVSLKEARDLAIRDALFAADARDKRLDLKKHLDIDNALARGIAGATYTEAKKAGPPSKQDIDDLTDKYYFHVQRLESWVTVHAIVLVPEGASADTNATAEKVAIAIREQVKPVAEDAKATLAPLGRDPFASQFEAAANSVPAQNLTVLIQALPGVATDGMTVSADAPRITFDTSFVKAATSLVARGDLSEPVRSASGWHVILLLDRIPAFEMPFEARQDLFADEIYEMRAQKNVANFLAELRKGTPSSIVENFAVLLGMIHIGDDPGQAAQVAP